LKIASIAPTSLCAYYYFGLYQILTQLAKYIKLFSNRIWRLQDD
jgi:hypothetical protein